MSKTSVQLKRYADAFLHVCVEDGTFKNLQVKMALVCMWTAKA